jgi:hypothetical protein
LAGRLKRNLEQESTSLVERNRNQFLKDSIPELESTAQYTTAKDPTRAHLFILKCHDALLVKAGVTRIIMSVQFDEIRYVWTGSGPSALYVQKTQIRQQNLRSGYITAALDVIPSHLGYQSWKREVECSRAVDKGVQ